MDIDIADNTVAVKDEDRTLRVTLLAENAVFLGDLAMWPKIT
jgi:hypothetical protein